MGQELTEEVEKEEGEGEEGKGKLQVDLARDNDTKGASRVRYHSSISKSVVNNRWAIPRKMAEGKKSVKAPLLAQNYQGPNQKDGNVSTTGRVSLRSSHLRVTYLAAIKNGRFGTLTLKMPFRTWAALFAKSTYEFPWNGNRRMRDAFGNCVRRPAVWMMRRSHFIGGYRSIC